MAVIKNLAFIPKERLRRLSFLENFEHAGSSFNPCIPDILNYMLPLGLKFLKESYAAIDNDKIYGFITLEKDDCNAKKLKISNLFLEENSVKYGELLINYVVNKFLAQGAESFFAVVDELDNKMLNLLIEVCKFRITAQEYLFKIKKSDFSYEKDRSYEFIRFSKNKEAAKIAEFYNGLINSHQLPAFEAAEGCFKDNIFVGLKSKLVFKYVLENTSNNKLFGYFTVSTRNNTDFILDAVLLPSYEAYLADVLRFVKTEISKRNSSWVLYVRIKSCFANFRGLLEVMNSYDFRFVKKSKILVKDLYRVAKSENSIYNKQIIFNAPAY